MADQQQRGQQGKQQPVGVGQDKGPDDLVRQPGRRGCRHKGDVIGLPQPEPGKERQQQQARCQQKQGQESRGEYGAEFQHGQRQLGKSTSLIEAAPLEGSIVRQRRPPGGVLEQGEREQKQQAGQQCQQRFSPEPSAQYRHPFKH